MVFVDLASYYYAFFVGLAFLAVREASLEWLALGAVVVGRLINLPSLVTENPDLQYTLHSLLFLTWAVLALVVLVWRRRGGPRTVPQCVAGLGQ